jgi:hypothetical protein
VGKNAGNTSPGGISESATAIVLVQKQFNQFFFYIAFRDCYRDAFFVLQQKNGKDWQVLTRKAKTKRVPNWPPLQA